jgi:RNA polymerase sigma factor (sigma-70 family)
MRDTDSSAYADVLHDHEGLAVMWARHHIGSGADFDDLLQDARIGLMRAVDRFEAARGAQFSTYASYWIRNALLRGSAAVVGPLSVSEEGRTLRRQLQAAVHERGATISEASSELGLATAVAERLAARYDAGHPPDDLQPEARHLQPEEIVLARLAREELIIAVASLDPDEQHLLAWRYGLGRQSVSRAVIAREFGLSVQRQLAVERTAINKLRSMLDVSPGAAPPSSRPA